MGVNPEYNPIGYLSIAIESEAPEALMIAKLRQEMGVETVLLGPEDIRELVPVVNTSDILVGVLGPEDGIIEPHAIMTGYMQAAQRAGAEICQGREFEVTGI